MHQIIEWNYWGLAFLCVFVSMWAIQMYYFFNYFIRVATIQKEKDVRETAPVSVIISARNEEKNLMEHIPQIMDQNHPEFELIVVNDSSWDDTEAILKALTLQYPNMKVINLDEEKQNMQGKKFALTLGVKAATHENILLTDADCFPGSRNWIKEMTDRLTGSTKIVLGFSPYKRQPGWLNRLIRFDTFMIGIQYIGIARAGSPYMGVGRNLAYTKELFFSVGGFKSHYSITSGDDDLFVNQVANKRNIAVVVHPDAQTVSEPKKNYKDWFNQKKRHLTTAPYYKTSDKNTLIVWPMSFILMLLAFTGCLVLKSALLVVGCMLLVRYIVQISILHASSKKLGVQGDLVWLSPFLEIHLHLVNAFLYITNLVRKPQKWN